MYKPIDKMSDYEAQQFIEKATIRLKETAYARGYKDGFNDAKNAGYFKQPVIEDRKNNEPMQVHESEVQDADCD